MSLEKFENMINKLAQCLVLIYCSFHLYIKNFKKMNTLNTNKIKKFFKIILKN